MALDKDKLLKYINDIEQQTAVIEAALNTSNQDLLVDTLKLNGLKYAILTNAEAVGSCLQHILAKKYFIAITGYSEIIKKAGEKEIISPDLLKRLVPFIHFRNMLVHHYWRVEDETFLENLRQGVNDFHKFREEIKEIIKKER